MRVAIVGTSNIGAFKYAANAIASAHPNLDVSYYGLPGGKFDTCRTGADGIFQPDPLDTKTRAMAERINGSAGIDLTTFDHLLVIGDTLGMPAALWTALGYDIADWPTRTGRDLLSLPAYKATLQEAITARADHLRGQFGAFKLHVALAPYPTTAVVPKGPLHQQPYASMASYPHAADVQSLYREALTQALNARDMTFIAQPGETIASPFLTHERFGHGAMDFRDADRALDDHRHMNANFGASLFHAFALTIASTQQI